MKDGEQTRELIVDVIVTYMLAYNYPPSYEEIMSRTGIKSKSTINMHLKILEEQGVLTHEKGSKRAIEVFGVHYVDERGTR